MLYAGAVMVLFLFLMMVMNLRPGRDLAAAFGRWHLALVLSVALLGELSVLLLAASAGGMRETAVVGPGAVGRSMFGPYLLAVEMAAILLLAALVAILYLSRGIGRRREGGP